MTKNRTPHIFFLLLITPEQTSPMTGQKVSDFDVPIVCFDFQFKNTPCLVIISTVYGPPTTLLWYSPAIRDFPITPLVQEVVAANHRCYVCIPNTGSSISDVLQMFPEGTVIPLCNQFDTDKSEFIRECPWPKYQGCLTQTNGSHVTKTCTELAIEDCKTANKIKYCYCKDELCNKESVPTEAPVPPEISTDDDEDSPSEGSGSPEGSDSRQLETSSESDLGIEVIRKKLPTTTKSVILTTPRPDGPVEAKATAGHLALPVNLLYVVSFLLVLRINFN